MQLKQLYKREVNSVIIQLKSVPFNSSQKLYIISFQFQLISCEIYRYQYAIQ